MRGLSVFPQLTPTAVIDILLVAFLLYQMFQIIRGRRAVHILAGIGILVLAYLVASWAQLELLRTLLATLAPYTAFALIVMFQSELRGMLAGIGRRSWFSLRSKLQLRESLEEMVLAVQQLAADKTGALIVIEGQLGLRTFIESGVYLDAHLSRDLLLSIFNKGSALHDGAVIVQGDRIAAAACFLPLTSNPVSRNLGTRHRAAIGITEEADCLTVVVSEETGMVSVARGGLIELHISIEALRERIAEAYGLGVRRQGQERPSAATMEQAEGS